jgi:dimethylglycine dehydrogenase
MQACIPAAHQLDVYRAIRAAGEDFGLRLVGSHALMSLRLEKSFPSWGLELTSDYYPVESGLDRFVAMDKGNFVGREALNRVTAPREKIATFAIDVADSDAYSGEPVYCNRERVGYVTSGGYGYRVEKSLALGYIDPAAHRAGQAFEIEIVGERYPAIMLDGPAYDPTGARSRLSPAE